MTDNPQINIKDNCIKCGRCEAVCPVGVFSRDTVSRAVTVASPGHCIGCGQCVAVCPASAISHSLFSDEDIVAYERTACPSPDDVMLLMKTRRSNRAMSRKPVERALVEKIIEAAYSSPTAHNSRDLQFTLVSSDDKLRMLTDFTCATYSRTIRRLQSPFVKPFLSLIKPGVYANVPVMNHVVKSWASGHDNVLRKATAVILISTRRNEMMSSADAQLAYQNASLMAESLGVAHFYLGYLCAALRLAPGKLEGSLGIGGTIHAAMAIGMPAMRFDKYIDRGCPEWSEI